MNVETININKSLIPYEFSIVLGAETFTFHIDYNNVGGFFTAGLSKNGVTLCSGTPIIYGRKLFESVWKPSFPAVDIIPLDLSNEYNKVTYDNLGKAVRLIIDNGETPLLEGNG